MASEETAPKGKKTPSAQSKPNVFARMMLFIRQVIAELKKVVYPTRSEMGTYFMVVLVFVCVIMLFIFLIDLGFDALIRLIYG